MYFKINKLKQNKAMLDETNNKQIKPAKCT